jgi:Uma2 family endonuclease
MSVTAEPTAAVAPRDENLPDVPIYRLSIAQYHAMAEAGILTEDDPVELLEGWLVRKMTKHRPHTLATLLVRQALERLLTAGGWYVDSQEPITTEDSEPEPDVVVVRGSARDYLDRQPGPRDVPLIIEVADTSLETDRGAKQRLYARAGIAVYWIINLKERQIEVYTDPSGPTAEPGYASHRDYSAEETLPVVLDGVTVGALDVAALLP